jgi:DNA-binding transcriptional LysR family regulator
MTNEGDWESGVGRRLKLRHLRIFSAVVARGSMARAAAQLRLSQPTVSEVIAELEDTFGVRLLDRSSQGVTPTVYGRALLKRSIAALDELKQSSRDIAFLTDPTVGEVRIGCQAALAVALMPPVVMRFSELYPRVVLYVDELPTQASQRAALQDRKSDLVLARAAAPALHDEQGLDVELLFNDRIAVVAGVHSRWSNRRRIDLAELVDEPWLFAAPHTWNSTYLSDAFRACGLDMPKASLLTQSVPLQIQLIAKGSHIAALSRLSLRLYAERYGLKELPVNLPVRPWPVVIMTLKNRTLSPVVERLIECAREVVKELANDQAPSGRAKTASARNSQTT